MNRSERGASAVIVAGSLLLIMAIAAVAIDGGMAFSERRQAQSAVDFASMAALLGATSCPSPCTASDAADTGALEAMDVVSENLPDATLDWTTCTDPGRPARFTVVALPTTACVSFTSNFDEARVVLPVNEVDTSFAPVIGQDSIDIGASAQAGQTSEASAAIVPFAFGGGTSTCLLSNQASQTVPPCDGPNDGNFGYLDIMQYGNDSMTPVTPESCLNGGAQARLRWNIAAGADHILGVKTPSDPLINDKEACPNRSETPNEIEVQTGSLPGGVITEGLVTWTAPNPRARLRCSSTQSSGCVSVRGVSLDDTPLWHFLTGSHGCGTVTNRTEMETCLNAWTPAKGVIFDADIGLHPRFSAVPRFATYPNTGFGAYAIQEFIPVYLDTIYAACNANFCQTVFSPGGGTPDASCPNPLSGTPDEAACGYTGTWGGSVRVEGLTALTLDTRMLPASVVENFPGSPGVRVINLTE